MENFITFWKFCVQGTGSCQGDSVTLPRDSTTPLARRTSLSRRRLMFTGVAWRFPGCSVWRAHVWVQKFATSQSLCYESCHTLYYALGISQTFCYERFICFECCGCFSGCHLLFPKTCIDVGEDECSFVQDHQWSSRTALTRIELEIPEQQTSSIVTSKRLALFLSAMN